MAVITTSSVAHEVLRTPYWDRLEIYICVCLNEYTLEATESFKVSSQHTLQIYHLYSRSSVTGSLVSLVSPLSLSRFLALLYCVTLQHTVTFFILCLPTMFYSCLQCLHAGLPIIFAANFSTFECLAPLPVQHSLWAAGALGQAGTFWIYVVVRALKSAGTVRRRISSSRARFAHVDHFAHLRLHRHCTHRRTVQIWTELPLAAIC